MTVGPYAGKKVSEAKPIIRDEMVAAGQAMPYSEPEKTVRGGGRAWPGATALA
jgi:leucyl-tRNA synthetase